MKKLLTLITAALLLVGCGGESTETKVLEAENNTFAVAADDTPEELIGAYISCVQGENYDYLYEQSFAVIDHLNSIESYTEALKELYGDITAVQYRTIRDGDDEKLFDLLSDSKFVSQLKCVKQEEGWICTTLFPEMKDYTIEVKHGETIRVNGSDLGERSLTDSDVVSSNLMGLSSTKPEFTVDRYIVRNMLEIPAITDDSGTVLNVMKDVTADILYVGKDITDNKELGELALTYAETCAKFPAQDTSLYSVQNIAVTDAEWYQRVSEVQNQWFTAHGVSRITNEKVIGILEQNDGTIIANVVFDYYATNGDVERTWNCGYQLTLMQVYGTWKIAGMGVDSTLNPNSKYYED